MSTERFAADLRAAIGGRSQKEVGTAAGLSQAAISGYLSGTNIPKPAQCAALERALGLAPGALSKHLGWVPVGADLPAGEEPLAFEEWLDTHATHLTAAQRDALRAVYASFGPPADALAGLADALADETGEEITRKLARPGGSGRPGDAGRRGVRAS